MATTDHRPEGDVMRRQHTGSRKYAAGTIALATAAMMVAGLTTAPTSTAEPGGRPGYGPGAPGIGDPYYPEYGNGGYDVAHYGIHDTYDPDTGRLTGWTRLRATATKSLSRFNLDLVLNVASVRVDGQSADFHQRVPQELVVHPAQGIDRGSSFVVVVRYRGHPDRIEGSGPISLWLRTKDGAVAVGEPQIAAWWFASNDHPRDKATFDITVTTPRGTQAISNGSLESVERRARTTDWHWSSEAPMATYLAFMAIGRYDIERGVDRGLPFLYAFSNRLETSVDEAARQSVRRTASITRFLETQFGAYPFEQIGGVVPGKQFFFALENQTRPVYSPAFFSSFGGNPNPFIIAHEMAHQWYGDALSVRNWRDIWLNEGFATYAEFLFVQHHFDVSPQRIFLDSYDDATGWRGFWKVRIGDPGPRHLFDFAVYLRGAMTLQALRNKLGRDDFFDLMRSWATKGANGSTAQFIRHAEKYVPYPLDRFFRVWLYTPKRPKPTAANGFVHWERLSPRAQERVDQLTVKVRESIRAVAAAESGRLAGRPDQDRVG